MTEEDIAFCMGELQENPLPEVDQEEHPLRILSQENMTVVSTFTGTYATDFACILLLSNRGFFFVQTRCRSPTISTGFFRDPAAIHSDSSTTIGFSRCRKTNGNRRKVRLSRSCTHSPPVPGSKSSNSFTIRNFL